MNPQGEHMKSILIRGLAVVGFISILFLGSWGTVQVVKFAPTALSNLAAITSFTSIFIPSEKITIDASNTLVSSGTAFELTWEHTGKPENGTYTFNYACKEGLLFQIFNKEEVYEEIQCDSPFSFSSNINSINLIPISKESRFIDVPIAITSVDESGNSLTLDDSFLTVVNEEVSGSSLSDTDTNSENFLTAGERIDEIFPISDSRSVSDSSGRVDLKVTILGTGTVDTDGVFSPTSSIKVTEKGTIRFSVTNVGSKTSDNWTFNAVLPTYPMHIFHSKSQKALAPGDRIDFTLGFDQLNGNLTEGVITINVDPTQSIFNEVTRDNNVAQVTFDIVQ